MAAKAVQRRANERRAVKQLTGEARGGRREGEAVHWWGMTLSQIMHEFIPNNPGATDWPLPLPPSIDGMDQVAYWHTPPDAPAGFADWVKSLAYEGDADVLAFAIALNDTRTAHATGVDALAKAGLDMRQTTAALWEQCHAATREAEAAHLPGLLQRWEAEGG